MSTYIWKTSTENNNRSYNKTNEIITFSENKNTIENCAGSFCVHIDQVHVCISFLIIFGHRCCLHRYTSGLNLEFTPLYASAAVKQTR